MRTQRLTTPNSNSLHHGVNNCTNDTNSSSDTNANAKTGSAGGNGQQSNQTGHTIVPEGHHNGGGVGDMHNMMNGNHLTSSSLITPSSSASLSPPRFNFNHGFCSPMYTPQMSISDSYG